jgi:uncharacterized protein
MPIPRPPTAPRGFHVMAKPTGAICNLDCSYCFYLDKEALYPDARFRMRDEVAETYVRQVIEAQDAPEVTIAWQGGEPTLMGLPFFRRVVALAESYRRPNQRLLHTMQTNGTLLDEVWAEFLAEKGFLVGISIDGSGELHDNLRVDKRGQPTLERVLRGLEFLRAHHVEYNVLCAVHAINAKHPRAVYRFLRDDCGARFIQFVPIVEHEPSAENFGAVSDRSVHAAQWGRFLIEVFDEWIGRDVGEVFVQSFDAALASWMHLPPGICVFAETCGRAVALEHNGDVYSCDHFVEPEHLLGNITTTHLVELLASENQRRFGNDKRDTLPRDCLECDVGFACNGECPKNRFIATPDGEPGLNYLCAGYQAFFRRVDQPMKLMADLLDHGRPASAITVAFSRAPRNSPCPCGSGQKAKACHGG